MKDFDKTLVDRMNNTPELKRFYRQETLILDVTENICKVMVEQKITNAKLAKRLGVKRKWVELFLSGEGDLNIRTISDVFNALDCECELVVKQ